MTWESVDLPEPFGPMMACTSPSLTVSESPWRISRSSTRTCRFLTSNNGIRLNPCSRYQALRIGLDPHALRRGISLIHHIAGIANTGRLEDDNFRFLVGGRSMLNPALDDNGVSGSQIDDP